MADSEMLKERLETFWGDLFSSALESHYSCIREICLVPTQEDPPDALYDVLCSNGENVRTWAEITNVYPSNAAAERLFRAARGGHDKTPNEPKRKTQWVNPDARISEVSQREILKKLTKSSYECLRRQYGKGHLLIVIPYQTYPLVNEATAQHVKSNLPLRCLERQITFCDVWLAYKQPDSDDGIVIVHSLNSVPSYAFVCLWQAREDAV